MTQLIIQIATLSILTIALSYSIRWIGKPYIGLGYLVLSTIKMFVIAFLIYMDIKQYSSNIITIMLVFMILLILESIIIIKIIQYFEKPNQ